MSYLHVSAAPIAGFLGQVPPPRASTGQYGLALSRIRIPAAAIELLVLSKTFRDMTDVLDVKYFDHLHWLALQKNFPSLRLNNDFRVVGGGAGFNGRRILYVSTDPSGSLFIPGHATASPTGWDIIRFKLSLDMSDTIPWVEAIAHETAHAFARVSAQGVGPTTPIERARAGVLDECKTRQREQKVLAEIRATPKGQTALKGHPPRTVRPCDCERDWFPAAQKRTYLEQFVLGDDWESAARSLGSTDRDKIVADVAAIPITFSTKGKPPSMAISILRGTSPVGSFAAKFPVLKSAAGQAAFVLRLVDASWRQLIAKVVEDSPTWKGGAYRLRLERHARVFFKIPVTYTDCPKETDHVP